MQLFLPLQQQRWQLQSPQEGSLQSETTNLSWDKSTRRTAWFLTTRVNFPATYLLSDMLARNWLQLHNYALREYYEKSIAFLQHQCNTAFLAPFLMEILWILRSLYNRFISFWNLPASTARVSITSAVTPLFSCLAQVTDLTPWEFRNAYSHLPRRPSPTFCQQGHGRWWNLPHLPHLSALGASSRRWR